MPPSKSLLPACKRCHASKCDRAAPRCTACTKAACSCVFLNDTDSLEYTRQDIAQLEEEEARLRSSLPGHVQGPVPDEFLGEASGSSFFETMLSNPRWRAMTSKLLHELRQRRDIPTQEFHKASLPSAIEARYYIDEYLANSHLHHPFCLQSDLIDLHSRLYPTLDPSSPAPQDYFRLYIVCAIASISLQRRGMQTPSPYSFFIAAQDFAEQISVLGSLDAIQNLLLMARFGIYFHIGCSTWEIARLCVRQCIQLEYHLKPRSILEPLREQHQRRVFWECYILDRYASSTLGRPFALSDEDIEVNLPLALSDETISSQSLSILDDAVVDMDPADTMSIFVWIVRLRQITSRIHSAFFTAANDSSATPKAGQAYAKLYQLLDDLDQWRQTGPVFADPVSLYQRQDWYDFLLEKERLSLVRGAMNRLSTQQNQSPPKTLTSLCIQAATRVIHLYKLMFVSKAINCTRGYFQMLFTAGLSLIYCYSFDFRSTTTMNLTNDIEIALHSCAEILRELSNILTDARPYSYAFKLMQSAFLAEYSRCTQSCPAPLQQENLMDRTSQPEHGAGNLLVQDTTLAGSLNSSTFLDNPGFEWLGTDSWLTTEWSPLTTRLVANMESDVNQYAVGDWMLPFEFDLDIGQLDSL